MRVLIVDDSVVMRSQIKASLEGAKYVEVVGVANNGKIALQKLEQSSIDLIILDMEMPELNGIDTIKAIRQAKFPVRILVFSALTISGSEATLDALSAGADDFIAKPSGPGVSLENAVEKIREQILPKIKQFLSVKERLLESDAKDSNSSKNLNDPHHELQKSATSVISKPISPYKSYPKRDFDTFLPQVLLIGSSTGGPPALEIALAGLSNPLRIPIFIAQHMPAVFTTSFAKRLTQITGITAAEGIHDEEVVPNRIYVAPGNFHMTLVKKNNKVYIQLDQNPHRNSVRPAVDPLFETASNVYGSRTCAFILTGMGEDGLVGSRAVKEAGGGVFIQNKESCVVFGMPGAIASEQIQDGEGDLALINKKIKKLVQ